MNELLDKYEDFALELLEEDRVEDAKTMLKAVGEMAITTELKIKGVNEVFSQA